MTATDALVSLPAERVLRLLVESILWLLAATMALAVFIIGEHVRRQRVETRNTVLEERWRHALHDVLGGDAEPSVLIALVEPPEYWRFADYLTDFAVMLRGEELELARNVARVALPDIVRTMFDGSPADVARHVRAIALLGGPEYAPQLTLALDHPASLVRQTAVRWLCRPEYAASAPAVISRLWRFRTWSPQFLGLLLARFGSAAAPSLQAVLESQANAVERVGAARALWWMKDAASAESAARLLSHRALDPELAEACLRLVERCGVEKHAVAVRRWCDLGDRHVRAAALAALSVVGEDADRALVLNGIRDPNTGVALDAAFALARAEPEALRALTQGTDQRVAAIAREALAR